MVHNHHGNNEYSVWCKKVLTCGIHGCAWPTVKEAAAAWNTRAYRRPGERKRDVQFS